MSDIAIPAAAMEAAKRAANEYLATDENHTEEKLLSAAFNAMIEAWPGVRDTSEEGGEHHWQHHIILPHPVQENPDADKA
jgi:hypothetical protein